LINEAFEANDDEELEEMAEDEINKIIQEVTDGKFESIAAIANQGKVQEEPEVEEETEDEEKNASRLANIKA